MTLIDIKKLEDCFDGSMIFKYSFDNKIEEILVRKLGERGKLDYYPDFPRPFFKITCAGVQVKGIIGDDNFEVVFPRTAKEEKKKNFESMLSVVLCGGSS
jgi:hypothetical protein